MIDDTYPRVIPRDLFNEAKLLKCLGQLCLHIHNETAGTEGLTFHHSAPRFLIEQHPHDGQLFCSTLHFYCGEQRLSLSAPYNSRENYPLLCDYDDIEYEVFHDDGSLHQEFKDYVLENIRDVEARGV